MKFLYTPDQVPLLPESAPFTPEQRAYLNGFLAGLFSRGPAPAPLANRTESALVPLTILFGSQTGNAEKLAKRAAHEAGRSGFAPTVIDLVAYAPAQLPEEQALLIITSTFGDGDPPDNARPFWDALTAKKTDQNLNTPFSVCALGDSSYPKFCAFGKALDEKLAALGGQRIFPRQDCDLVYETPFLKWLAGALEALRNLNSTNPAISQQPLTAAPTPAPAATEPLAQLGFTRERPFSAELISQRPLGGPGSSKEVRHFELSLKESGLTYEPGDALGVWPVNDPILVDEILTALGCDGEEAVAGLDGKSFPLRYALQTQYELRRVPPALLQFIARQNADPQLTRMLRDEARPALAEFVSGRELIDILTAWPTPKMEPVEFVRLLPKLQPRLYSIASSLKAHPERVDLCVNIVRYESFGRKRHGVASTFLADRTGPGKPVRAFVHPNPNFRLPPPDAPHIMIGPGTGIAPFRAFLEERRQTGASGLNWLFFGDQHAATDFLYRDEIETFKADGLLTRLDLAWSRDQYEKIYVQHRMLQCALEFFQWLEAGAYLSVCGDANRMAKDVDKALHQIVQNAAHRTPEQASEYVAALRTAKRYRRDVY